MLVAAEPPCAIPVYLPMETTAAVTGSSSALDVLKIMLWSQTFGSHLLSFCSFNYDFFKVLH